MACGLKTASDFMRQTLVTLRPGTTVIEAVKQMLRDNISGAPVVDEHNRYLGVFSEKCCMNALTEVVQQAQQTGLAIPRVRQFMNSSLITLSPDLDV
ncbi:MAG: CBS domain-containing protein, partial [Planctomycetaceae bacterium]